MGLLTREALLFLYLQLLMQRQIRNGLSQLILYSNLLNTQMTAGNFVGIDVDVLDAIAKDQGFEYELKSLGWGRFYRCMPGWTG